jgi:hypothetical protein
MKLLLPIPCSLLLLGLIACASLNRGADPLVVRVEQGESLAMPTFELILHEDNANRAFWMTNAPAFHNFAEWLRTPTRYNGTNVSRSDAMQFNVDDLKMAYKGAKTAGNSNALYTAFGVLEEVVSQGTSWRNIIQSPIHPAP